MFVRSCSSIQARSFSFLINFLLWQKRPRGSETHIPLNVKIRNSANPPLWAFRKYCLFKNDVIFHKMVLKIDVICADFLFPFSLFCKKTSNYLKIMSKYKKWHNFTIKWNHKNKCSIFETAYAIMVYTRLSRISAMENKYSTSAKKSAIQP